MLEAAILVK